MTIKVGLYGDSYGTGALPKLPDGTYDSGYGFHWIHTLAKKFYWSVTNTSTSGSSIFESYMHFLQTHHEHEKNIFIITSAGRYHRSIELANKKSEYRFVHLAHLEHFIKTEKDLTEDDLEVLNDLRGWFNMSSIAYEDITGELMIKHIQELRPDTIFILSNKFPNFLLNNYNKPLHEIYIQQCHMLGFEPSLAIANENTKLISGHFTPEFNDLMAQYIIKRLETGMWPEWEVPGDFKFAYTKKEYFGI